MGDPFPISPALSKDLDKLSLVAARILSTPDIYDVNNLARPGVCGDYAVFLKKGLEKKLLPFVMGVGKDRMEVVYQNPRKAFDDLEKRKKICSALVNTMLRAIATVVACLGSIQVAYLSRQTVVAGVGREIAPATRIQVGGSINDARDWLINAGYLPTNASAKTVGTPIDMIMSSALQAKKIGFKLTFKGATGILSDAQINAVGGGTGDMEMPKGSLKIHFLNPVQIPMPGSTPKTVLPIRIIDNGGITWMAGILYENIFKSFTDKGRNTHYGLLSALEGLFRRTQGWQVPVIETRADINAAEEVFQRYKRSMDPNIIFQTLGRFFQEEVSGYQAGYVAPAAGAGFSGYGAPAYPGIGAPTYPGAPVSSGYGYIQPPRPTGLSAGLGAGSFTSGYGAAAGQIQLRPPGYADTTAVYDIPSMGAIKSIIDSFKLFRELLPRENSPAAVRAKTLAALERPDRTIETGACSDPYWIEPNLSKIYPWATFQFLSVKEWDKLSSDRSKITFEPEWTEFVDRISSQYSVAPKLDRTGNSYFLDQMRFKGIADIAVCRGGKHSVGFREVEAGLVELQAIYKQHVGKMWEILNKLVVVIQDPDTNQDLVRLHPDVFATVTTDSKGYVDARAKEAREALRDFYANVEAAYLRAVNSLVIKS